MVDGVIVLYDQNETSFTSNGLGYLPDATKCTVIEELNGEFELEMEYPITGKRYDQIQHRRILYVKTNPYEDPQPFRIYNINKPIDGLVEVNARHISYDLSGYALPWISNGEGEKSYLPFATGPASAVENLPALVNQLNTGMQPFTYWTNSTEDYPRDPDDETQNQLKEPHWIFIDTPTTARNLLGIFTEKYKGEFKFDKFNVKFYGPVSGQSEDDTHYRGKDSGVVLRYGKNLTDLMQEEDSDKGMYTHIYPFWSGSIDVQKEGSEQSTTETKETVIELADKLYPVNSNVDPGYKRIYVYDVTSDYTDELKSKDKLNHPSEETLKEMCDKLIKENKLGTPNITLTASFVQLSKSVEYSNLALLEKILLGDTVTVDFPKLDVKSTLKCTAIEYNVLTDEYKTITLGDERNTNSGVSSTIASTASISASNSTAIAGSATKQDVYNKNYDTALSTTSENAVQNKVVTWAFNNANDAITFLKNQYSTLSRETQELIESGKEVLTGTTPPSSSIGNDDNVYVEFKYSQSADYQLDWAHDCGGSTMGGFDLTVEQTSDNVPTAFLFNGSYQYSVRGCNEWYIKLSGFTVGDVITISFNFQMSDDPSSTKHVMDYVNTDKWYDHGIWISPLNDPDNSHIKDNNDKVQYGWSSAVNFLSVHQDLDPHSYEFDYTIEASDTYIYFNWNGFKYWSGFDGPICNLNITDFTITSTRSKRITGINNIYYKYNDQWWLDDRQGSISYGTENPSSATEGDIYAKIHEESESSYTLDLSKAIFSSSYPSYGIAKFENSEIILKITSAGAQNYYENSAAVWKLDLTNVSSIEATCYHTIRGNYGVCLGVGTKSELNNNESSSAVSREYLHDEILGYHSETINIPINQEFTITTDVSSLTGEHYIGISTDINEELHITDVKVHLINPEPELVIDDIFYKINGEWKTETDSGGSTVSVTPIQTTGTHIADIEVDGVTSELYAPSGGGGSSTTFTNLYSNTAKSNPSSITLPTSWTEFDAIYVCGNVFGSSRYFRIENTVLVGDLSTGVHIGYTSEFGYCWYLISDQTTLTFYAASNGHYIYSIYGVKYGSGGGSGSDDYSTTETRIGTWIDGKPLYRKVATLTLNHTGTYSSTYLHNWAHGIQNVDTCVSATGYVDDNGDHIMFGFYVTYSVFISVIFNTTNVNFRYSSGLDGKTCTFILEYTKTTD